MELKDFKIGGKFRFDGRTFVCTDVGTRTAVASCVTGVDRFKSGCKCYPPLTEEEAIRELSPIWTPPQIPLRWATEPDPAEANILPEEVFDKLMMPHCEALP